MNFSNIFKNIPDKFIIIGLLSFTGSLILNFIQVPILLDLLSTEGYGVWATIFSIASMINYLDFGIANGIRLKLTELFSKKRYSNIIANIQASYLVTIIVAFFICSILYVITQVFNIAEKINPNQSKYNIISSINVFIIGIAIILILKVGTLIFSSIQKPQIEKICLFLSQFFFVFTLVIFPKEYFQNNLVLISLIYIFSHIVVLIFVNVYIFLKIPNILNTNKFKLSLITDNLNLNLSFFLIQISSLVLYSTDNYIISFLISPDKVTEYSIDYKYYGIPHTFYSLYISLYWPHFISLYSQGEISTIVSKVFVIKKFFFLNLLFVLTLLSLKPLVFQFWLGSHSKISVSELDYYMIFYFLLSSLTTIFTYIVNATGKIKLQRNLYLIIALINIPLSVIFIKLGLGVNGVILSSSLCMLILLIPIYYQASSILKE